MTKEDIMTQAIFDIKNDVGFIKGTTLATKETVDSHDDLLKTHGTLLTEINNRTLNLDSWKNGIIHTVTEEKEKALAVIRSEIKPMKDEYEEKQNNKKGMKGKVKGILWGSIEKGTYAVGGGGMSLLILKIIKLFQ